MPIITATQARASKISVDSLRYVADWNDEVARPLHLKVKHLNFRDPKHAGFLAEVERLSQDAL